MNILRHENFGVFNKERLQYSAGVTQAEVGAMSRDRFCRPVQPSSPCKEVGFIASIRKSHCRFLRKVYLLEGKHSCFHVENGL